jgi:hypothetical protein
MPSGMTRLQKPLPAIVNLIRGGQGRKQFSGKPVMIAEFRQFLEMLLVASEDELLPGRVLPFLPPSL